jgi:uncharacterized protein YecE (DUF72 family)
MPRQPSLFSELDESPEEEPQAGRLRAPRYGEPRRSRAKAGRLRHQDEIEERYTRLREIAAALPPDVRFGTSSWSFPGWRGLVYSGAHATGWLAKEGLREYARHPLFGTVGVDRSYYAPIPDDDFDRYREQLPDGFPCCCKAPEAVTSPVVPNAPRRGPASRAVSERSEPNGDFLSPDRFVRDLIEPVARTFRDHAGPFILQFPPMLRRSGLAPAEFVEGLDRFLGCLPGDFHYAVEVRDRALLSPDYVGVLEAHGVAHVYNAWTAMPLPGAQASVVPVEKMPFLMVRLLLRPGATYQEQREAFAPFDRIPEPQEEMREQVVDLVGQAVARAIPAYVLVNNKAEGSSPLTIEALAEAVARHRRR